MRTLLTFAALAALASGASATTTTTHHRHTMAKHTARADSGSAEVKALNEKSLQQAQATPMTTPGADRSMSDSGNAAPMAGSAGGAPMSGGGMSGGGMSGTTDTSNPGTAANSNAPTTGDSSMGAQPTTPPQQ